MIGVFEYYRNVRKEAREAFSSGTFCWTPIPFVHVSEPNRLRLDFFDEDKPHNASYTLERTLPREFDPRDDKPLRHLNLASDEFLLATPHKFRPSIIITETLGGSSTLIETSSGVFVVPVFSLHDAGGNYKWWASEEVVLRAQAYQLRNAFYLPVSEKFRIGESLARFDRMQFVRLDHLVAMPVALTSKMQEIFLDWAYHFLGCPILNPALEEFIERMAKEVDRELGGEAAE